MIVVGGDHHRDQRLGVRVGPLVGRLGPKLPQALSLLVAAAVDEAKDLDHLLVPRRLRGGRRVRLIDKLVEARLHAGNPRVLLRAGGAHLLECRTYQPPDLPQVLAQPSQRSRQEPVGGGLAVSAHRVLILRRWASSP